jgi:hypothetical protein
MKPGLTGPSVVRSRSMEPEADAVPDPTVGKEDIVAWRSPFTEKDGLANAGELTLVEMSAEDVLTVESKGTVTLHAVALDCDVVTK